MRDFFVRHVGVYRHSQTCCQEPTSHFLFLNVSGLRRFRIPGFDLRDAKPFLAFILAGEILRFEFGADRENWVAQFDSDSLAPGTNADVVALRWGEDLFELDRLIWAPEGSLGRWRTLASDLAEAHRLPIPQKRLETEFLLLQLLRLFISSDERRERSDVVDAFRERLDAPENFHRPLADVCAEFAYSPDHMRMLFKRRFLVTPGEYRRRRRMGLCMDLIADGELSIKEIAYATGFKHFSHFSAAFATEFGMTAREAARRRRLG